MLPVGNVSWLSALLAQIVMFVNCVAAVIRVIQELSHPSFFGCSYRS